MFVVEGVRLVEEAANRDWRLETVLFDGSLSERGKSQVESLKSKGIEVEEISTDLMKSISETETPQGILAILQFSQLPFTNNVNFILIPDQIRDPGNLGTLLRSAAATGVQAVLIPPETTDAFAPKVLRAGMGAHFRVPIREMEWEEIEQVCKLANEQMSKSANRANEQMGKAANRANEQMGKAANMQILLADMNGKSCWETDLRQPLALIVGGEAEGASEQARKIANQQISIPMAENVESLNAGVAGSVLMFEVVRQRSLNTKDTKVTKGVSDD